MSTNVRCFAIEGMIAGTIASYSSRNSENAIWLPKVPYLANEALAVSSSSVTSGTALTDNQHANMLMVEVQANKRVRYEVSTKNGALRPATQDSPVLYGEGLIAIGQGYRISFIEDADA